MSTPHIPPHAPPAADDRCWFEDPERHPSIGRCPAGCNGAPTHGERQADGRQRSYCEAHAHWRVTDGGRARLYLLERAGST